jgi:CelD/BcsL family acetyltransferase involved in cellulose biosynthesis
VDTSLGTVSLRITSNLASLEAVWEKLQASVPCSAAQTYDWARAWTHHVLNPAARRPVIVGTPEQDPLFCGHSKSEPWRTQRAEMARSVSCQLQHGAVRAARGVGAQRR